MSSANDLCGLGVPAEQAGALGFTPVAVTAAGTTSADATALLKQQTYVTLTATGSDGIRMAADAPLLTPYWIANTSGSNGKVYPGTGGAVNGGSTDAGETIATTTVQIWMRTSTNVWTAVLGA